MILRQEAYFCGIGMSVLSFSRNEMSIAWRLLAELQRTNYEHITSRMGNCKTVSKSYLIDSIQISSFNVRAFELSETNQRKKKKIDGTQKTRSMNF